MVKQTLKETIIHILPIINIASFGLFVLTIVKFGWLGLIIYVILYTAFLLWLSWEHYMRSMRLIEGMIWGKPLDEEYWKKGEKRPKVKIVWRKNVKKH